MNYKLFFIILYSVITITLFITVFTFSDPSPQIGNVKCMNGYKYRYSVISSFSSDWIQIIGENGGGISCDK